MKMRIALVLSMIESKAKWHHGIAALASFLEREGHAVHLHEITANREEKFLSSLQSDPPDIVGFSATTNQFPYIVDLSRKTAGRAPKAFRVLGGIHPTIAPDIESIDDAFDVIIRGEGEKPLAELANDIASDAFPRKIPNCTYLSAETAHLSSPCSWYLQDLDSLPIARRSLFQRYREADRNSPLPFNVRFLFCRGCPFNCSYCCNRALKDAFPETRHYVRRMSVNRAIEEIQSVAAEFRFNRYVIDDDIFTLNKKWVLDFCNAYPASLIDTKRFEINIRIGTIDREILEALKSIGCDLVKMGLESGDPAIRKEVLNRSISDEQILETCDVLQQAGMPFHTFNMVGIPGESHRQIWKTIRMNQRIQPTRTQVTVMYPYPHTELGDRMVREKRIEKEAGTYFHRT